MNSFIEKSLKGRKVEWKTLGEVGKIVRGRRLTRNLLSENEKFPVFHGGLVPLGYYSKSNRIGNTVMIINVGASAGTVGYSKVDFWSSDGCYCIEHLSEINSRFLYYFLVEQEFYLKSKVRVAGIPTLDVFVIEKIEIPLPPLDVQAQIVEVLDKFTELEAELEARKRQYYYYRELLLDFNTPCKWIKGLLKGRKVEWKTLGEVCEIVRGVRVTKKDLLYNGTYPVVSGGVGYMGFINKYNRETNTITIAQYGTAGYVSWQNQKFWANDVCFCVYPNDNVVNRYLYYFLMQQQNHIYEISNKTAVPFSISKDKILSLQIPLPPLDVQKQIVKILDKFDTLVNDISEGLPKEIELRKKQYEYYRDQLLTFPK